MQRDDVVKLQSYLYVQTQLWPKWKDLRDTVNQIRAWEKTTSGDIYLNYPYGDGGVYSFSASKFSNRWHFTESGHSGSHKLNYKELFNAGQTVTEEGIIIQTDVVYGKFHKFEGPFAKAFVETVVRYYNYYRTGLTKGSTLMIKDVKCTSS